MRTRFGRAALLALVLSSLAFALPAEAQITQEGSQGSAPVEAVPPPPGTSAELAAPQPVVVVQQPVVAQPQPLQPQPLQPQPVAQGQSASAYGQPMGTPASTLPTRRRGDHLEDTANTGEIVDLMITTGAYGVMLGNSIVVWTDSSGTPSHVTASILGAALSLTGLLAIDTPRGVPTTMAVGLRYGLLFSLFGYGTFAGGSFDGEAALAAMSVGGIVGYGVGAAIGVGGRPHVSRTRFVEAGGLWGAGFATLLAAAGCDSCNGSIFGALLAGSAGGVLAHTLVAFLAPVSTGRGWLLNAAFAAGAGLGALLPWGLTNGDADPRIIAAISAATGFVALGVVFAISDGIQDSGWDDAEEVLSRMQIGVGPTQGGAVGTVSGQF